MNIMQIILLLTISLLLPQEGIATDYGSKVPLGACSVIVNDKDEETHCIKSFAKQSHRSQYVVYSTHTSLRNKESNYRAPLRVRVVARILSRLSFDQIRRIWIFPKKELTNGEGVIDTIICSAFFLDPHVISIQKTFNDELEIAIYERRTK